VQKQQNPTPEKQPLKLTEILDAMFNIYRKHFNIFLRIIIVFWVGDFTIDMITMYLIKSEPTQLMFLPTYRILPYLFLFIFVSGAVSYASAQIYLDRNITAVQTLRHTWQRYSTLIGCTIIYALVATGLVITCIGIPVAIYFFIRWGLHGLPILVEETTATTALRRSTELVKGTWWRVCGIITALLLIYHAIQLITSTSIISLLFLIPGAVEIPQDADMLQTINVIVDPAPHHVGWIVYTVRTCLTNAIETLTLPIPAIGSTLLYYDLRIRKEAYDIEIQATNERTTQQE